MARNLDQLADDLSEAQRRLDDMVLDLGDLQDEIDRLRTHKGEPAAPGCVVTHCEREATGSGSLEYASPVTRIPVVLSVPLCEAHLRDRPDAGFYAPSRARWEAVA